MKETEKIRGLISDGKIGKAIDNLISFTKEGKTSSLYDRTVLVSNRFRELEKENGLGLMGFDQYHLEKSKISYAILHLLNDIDNYKEIKDGRSNIGSDKAINVGSSTNNLTNGNSPRTRILFLASNPTGTAKLKLTEEFKRVAERLQEGGQSNKFEFFLEWQPTVGDLQQYFKKKTPYHPLYRSW